MTRSFFLPLLLLACAAPAAAQDSASGIAAMVADREEAMARTIGTQAVIYGYPAVDYLRLMGETTTRSNREYAPLDGIFNEGHLTGPGDKVYADGKAKTPNNDTIYFRSWIDLRSGPRVVSVPDTADRYYTLTFADFYSEVQHTGRRTTGTAAQQVLVIGPGWRGTVPAGMHPIRVRTQQVLMLGRMLARPGADEKTARALIDKVRIAPLERAPQQPAMALPGKEDLTTLAFFTHLNRWLRDNPRLPGEEALMAQFDAVGIGPGVAFDPAALSPAARRGLEQALADGRRLIAQGRVDATRGWTKPSLRLGEYGYNYLQRAAVEYSGLHANLPAEALYLRLRTDARGEPLVGSRRYRLTLPAGKEPPADAFWSLIPYDTETFDMIPNPARIYSVGDRSPTLKRNRDGAIVVAIQRDRPAEDDVNWLPIGDKPFFLIMRFYQPRAEVMNGTYVLPDVEVLP